MLYRGPRLVAADDVAPHDAAHAPRAGVPHRQPRARRPRTDAERNNAPSPRHARTVASAGCSSSAAILLVVALVVGGLALNQRQSARSNADRATSAQDTALARAGSRPRPHPGQHEPRRRRPAARGRGPALRDADRLRAPRSAHDAHDAVLRSVARRRRSRISRRPGRDAVTDRLLAGRPVLHLQQQPARSPRWDAATRRPIAHQPVVSGAGPVTFAVNAAGLLASRGHDGIRIWDLQESKPLLWHPRAGRPPDGRTWPSPSGAGWRCRRHHRDPEQHCRPLGRPTSHAHRPAGAGRRGDRGAGLLARRPAARDQHHG